MDAAFEHDCDLVHDRTSQTFVNGFARGLSVIEAFANAPDALSLTEVATRAGLDRAVARRMLLTLLDLGFVARTQKRFRLTPRVMRLGYAFLSQAGFDDMLRPFLVELAQKLSESVSVSVLDGNETVAVCHVTSTVRKTRLLLREGTRWPAYVMASGRVLLSGLTDRDIRVRFKDPLHPFTRKTLTSVDSLIQAVHLTRQRGYALIDEELEDGIISASVPVYDRQHKLVASVNASSAKSRRTVQNMREQVVPLLQQTSREIGPILPLGILSAG
jgi:IclR family transcriptional regulator, pca regulon regulatory protein